MCVCVYVGSRDKHSDHQAWTFTTFILCLQFTVFESFGEWLKATNICLLRIVPWEPQVRVEVFEVESHS